MTRPDVPTTGRFVVTGAGGFLGQGVVRLLLLETTHRVVAVTSQGAERLHELLWHPAHRNPASAAKPEVLSTAQVLEPGALRAGDVVINCAFPWNRGGEVMANGLEFLVALLDRAAASRVRTFVNVSSQSVYSQARTAPASESSVIDCDTPYATAKYALELAGAAMLAPGVLVNARMSSLIGVGYDIRIVNRFIRQILRGETLSIQGGDQSFDFMDVRDAARALIEIGKRGAMPSGTALNVGSSNPLTLRAIVTTVANVVAEELGRDVPIEWGESEGDNRTLGLDCSLLRSEYGFSPRIPFEESVRSILYGILATDAVAWVAPRPDRLRQHE